MVNNEAGIWFFPLFFFRFCRSLTVINGFSVKIRPVFTPSCNGIRTLTLLAQVAVKSSAGVRGLERGGLTGSNGCWIERDTDGVNDSGREVRTKTQTCWHSGHLKTSGSIQMFPPGRRRNQPAPCLLKYLDSLLFLFIYFKWWSKGNHDARGNFEQNCRFSLHCWVYFEQKLQNYCSKKHWYSVSFEFYWSISPSAFIFSSTKW